MKIFGVLFYADLRYSFTASLTTGLTDRPAKKRLIEMHGHILEHPVFCRPVRQSSQPLFIGRHGVAERNIACPVGSPQTYMTPTKRQRPNQRVTIHQPQIIGYTFADTNYYTVCRDHVMLSDLPPWYMVLGPGTITALRTIRALLRIKIPMETDFSSIYRLMRTVCLNVTFEEVADAMVTFFSPPRQEFEEFLLGFALRRKNENSEERFSEQQCIFYSAIAYFSIENFEKTITNPIPPLTMDSIAPTLYWVLKQSVKDPADILEAFKRILLAGKSPYIRSLPNTLISLKRLDQATRQFDWCDCKGRAIKHDYLHTKYSHRDLPQQAEQEPLLPRPIFIEKQSSFKKYLQRAKERFLIPFSYPKVSLFKGSDRQIDPTIAVDYSHQVRRAKRIYENKLNKSFERCAVHFWDKYYKDTIPNNSEGRLFEVFKLYHQTQLCPRKREKIKNVYKTTKFKTMPDNYDFAEVYTDPDLFKFFCSHPCHSEFCSLDPHFSHLVQNSVCGCLDQFNAFDNENSYGCACGRRGNDTSNDSIKMSDSSRGIGVDKRTDIVKADSNDSKENITNNDNTIDNIISNNNNEDVSNKDNDNVDGNKTNKDVNSD